MILRKPWLLLSLLFLYVLLAAWTQIVVHPQFAFVDIDIYYRAGQLAGQGLDPYQTAVDRFEFVYPPPALLLFIPLAKLAYSNAASLWIGINLAAYLASIGLLLEVFPPSTNWKRFSITGILLLLYNPLLETLSVGQVDGVVLLGITALITASIQKKNSWLLDALFSIAVLIKMTPAILLLIPLLQKDYRRLLRIAVCSAALILLSWLVLGTPIWQQFITVFPQLFGGAPQVGFLNQRLATSIEMLVPSIRAAVLSPLLSVTLLGIFAISGFLRRNKAAPAALLMLGAVTLTIAPSLVWYHHLIFLVPAILFLEYRTRQAGSPKWLLSGIFISILLIQANRLPEAVLRSPAILSNLGYLLLYGFTLWTVWQDRHTPENQGQKNTPDIHALLNRQQQ